MKKYPIRDLLVMDPEIIWEQLRGEFIVVCDDGEIVTNRKETWFSTFAWQIFKEFPLPEYRLEHHFAYHFKNKLFRSTSHFPLLEACGFSAMDAHRATLTPERLAEVLFKLICDITNAITTRFGKYVASIDIFDFIDLANRPEVVAIKAKIEPNEQSINQGAQEFEKMVMDPKSAIGLMPICRMAQTKLIKLEQLTQCCLIRGYCQDVDASVFRKPIMRSFVEGIRKMDDFIAESRSAAVAISMAGNPLQMAEYSSRKMQFLDQIITTLHRGDCGASHFVRITLRDTAYDEFGRVARSSDFEVWDGKYYHTGDGVLKILHQKDKSLLGQPIYVRTSLGCVHPDPYGVCEVCVGKVADTYFQSTNVGNNAANTLNKDLLQLLLSAKHYLGSADVEKIVLDDHSRKFFVPDTTQTNYLLRDDLVGEVQLLLSPAEAINLSDVDLVDDVWEMDKSRISQIRTVGFELPDGRLESMNIGLRRRSAMMSHELLEYAKTNRWDFDSNGNYRIKLDKWNTALPIFSLPLRNYNIAEHTKDLAEFIEANAEQLYKRDSEISPHQFLLELSDLVNKRSAISISVLEIVMKGLTIVSADDRNYNLPKPHERMGIGVLKPLMNYRSLSTTLAFMGHRDALKNPANFVLKDRPDHPMDVLIMPREVVREAKYYEDR